MSLTSGQCYTLLRFGASFFFLRGKKGRWTKSACVGKKVSPTLKKRAQPAPPEQSVQTGFVIVLASLGQRI